MEGRCATVASRRPLHHAAHGPPPQASLGRMIQPPSFPNTASNPATSLDRQIARLLDPAVADDAALERAHAGIDARDVGVAPGRDLVVAGDAQRLERRLRLGAEALHPGQRVGRAGGRRGGHQFGRRQRRGQRGARLGHRLVGKHRRKFGRRGAPSRCRSHPRVPSTGLRPLRASNSRTSASRTTAAPMMRRVLVDMAVPVWRGVGVK